MILHKKVTEVFYDPEEDCFGYQVPDLKQYDIDDLYRISAELICLLSEVYEHIGERRNKCFVKNS
jgi:hypothetical protein